MNKKQLGLIGVAACAIILSIGGWYTLSQLTKSATGENESSQTVQDYQPEANLITVSSPQPNATITSPVNIQGQARGSWYFEATFPISIQDANGKVLGESFAQAEGEWMTEEFVPFSAQLTFSAPETSTGEIILEKANPSGLPENENQIKIPVKFNVDQ